MSDGVLTIGVPSGLNSLVMGTADRYQEDLHPNELIVINARGTLSDGRSFRFQAKYSVHDEAPQVQIVIR